MTAVAASSDRRDAVLHARRLARKEEDKKLLVELLWR